jgi:DNA-binding transcriptional LysR family regulator
MITTLERRLGEPLFVKGRRPLRPTPLGATLASYGRAILDVSRKAAEAAHNHKGGGAGLVRLGGGPYIMDGFVSRMIASFQLKDPDIRIEQSYGYMDELLNRLSWRRSALLILLRHYTPLRSSRSTTSSLAALAIRFC